MNKISKTKHQLLKEYDKLRNRLAESEETLEAIRTGAVDAIVVSDAEGEKIFSLQSIDYSYRVMAENMNEGTVTLDENGLIVFTNKAFSDLTCRDMRTITGARFSDFLISSLQDDFAYFLKECTIHPGRGEFSIAGGQSDKIPVSISGTMFTISGKQNVCLIISDLRERKAAEQKLRNAYEEVEKKVQERTAELQASEERYRSVLDNSQDVIYRLNAQTGRYEYISPFCEKVVGYSPEEMMNLDAKTSHAMVHPEDLPAFLAAQTRLKETGSVSAEYRQRTKSGEYRWLSNHMSLTKDSTSRALYRTGNIRDITKRKKAEEALRRQNATLEAISTVLAAALTAKTEKDLGVVCLDIAQQLTQSKFGFIGEIKENGLEDIAISNPGWDACRIFDIGGHRTTGGSFKIHGIYGRVISDGKSLFTNNPADHADRIGLPGGHPPLEAFLGVPLIREGRVIGIIALANRPGGYSSVEQETLEALAPAIVEAFSRKRAEEALRESEAKFHSVLDSSIDVIYRFNVQTNRYEYISPSAEKVLGYSAAEIMSWSSDATFDKIHPDDLPALRAALADTGTKNLEYRWRDKTGSYRWISNHLSIIKDGSSRPLYRNGNIRDVTKRKQAEEALRKSEERLRLAQENANVGIWDWNVKTGALEFTPELNKLYGLLPGTIKTYQDWRERVHPDDIGSVEIKRDEAIKEHKQFDLEFRGRHSSGDYRWISTKGGAVYDEEDHASRVFGVNIDITERKKAEEALAAAHRRTQDVIDNTTSTVYAFDPEERLLMANAAVAELFNSTSEQMIGKRRHEFMPKEDADWHEANDRKVFESGSAMEFEEYSQLKGRSITWLTTKFPLRDVQGRIYGVAGISTDITERKRAEEERALLLAEIENQAAELDATISSMATGLIVYDQTGKATYINAVAKELLPYKIFETTTVEERAQVINWETEEGLPFPTERIPVARALHGEISHNVVIAATFPDHKLWISASAAPILTPDGRMLGVVATFVDITDRKLAENALKKSEMQLKIAQEIAHLGSWELDLTHNLLKWSDEVYRIFGLQPHEFAASYEAFLDAVHPDDRAAVDAIYAGSIREGRDGYEIEHRVVRKSTGEIRVVQEKCRHFRNESGRVVRSVGMVHDITERKRIEEELRHSVEKLAAANKELEAFNYSVSHDLRNPLHAIKAMLAVLLDEQKDMNENAQKAIDCINKSSERMVQVINDLLSLSRISRTDLKPVTVPLSDIAQEFVDTLLSNNSQNAAEVIIAPGLTAGADGGLARILLENLLRNAWKFSSKSARPRIEFGAQHDTGRPVYYVRDNGVGFDMASAGQMFEPFKRFHSDTEFAGSGIGLAIVKRIVEKHGGAVWAESAPGKGATFYFTFNC